MVSRHRQNMVLGGGLAATIWVGSMAGCSPGERPPQPASTELPSSLAAPFTPEQPSAAPEFPVLPYGLARKLGSCSMPDTHVLLLPDDPVNKASLARPCKVAADIQKQLQRTGKAAVVTTSGVALDGNATACILFPLVAQEKNVKNPQVYLGAVSPGPAGNPRVVVSKAPGPIPRDELTTLDFRAHKDHYDATLRQGNLAYHGPVARLGTGSKCMMGGQSDTEIHV